MRIRANEPRAGRYTRFPAAYPVALAIDPVRLLSIALFLFASLFSPGQLSAVEKGLADSSDNPTPMQDDANLHDVRFITENLGWAVGDRGVILRSADAGRSWRLLPSHTDGALRSVCFLNDRVGWVAGGSTAPFTRIGVGILLGTSDGGKTWADRAHGRFSQLHFVRFFTPQLGVVVGEAAADAPTGVWTTRDGGKNWNALEGEIHPGWRAADFLNVEIGVTVGLNGAAARIDGKMSSGRAGGFGVRGLHGVTLSGDVGWAVGDGALILHTVNRGVVWQGPPAPLPADAADLFDFRTVAAHGDRLWIAGSPGTIVWHSADSGATWTAQRTGQLAPIERVVFQTDRNGWAVGAFGSILRTEDGGVSWRPVRAANRRAAILSILARPREISFDALAKEAGELGYRSIVTLPYRGEGTGNASLDAEIDVHLQDAVVAAGGNQGTTGWRFTLEVPGIDRDADRLRAEWMRRTEGKFEAAFHGTLVSQIRMWRPAVVVVDQPAPGDAAGNVLVQAVVQAVREAADPGFFPAHRDVAALVPWEVSRVFVKLSGNSRGDFNIDANGTLPRLRSTVAEFAHTAGSRLCPIDSLASESDAFRLVYPPSSEERTLHDFFTGMVIPPESDSRRRLAEPDAAFDASARRFAEQDRNARAIARQRVASGSHGSELIAMLSSSTEGRASSTAAMQLSLLAETYRRNRQWDFCETTLVELIGRYPNEPVALDAMQWLLQFWVGAEPTYQRLRALKVEEIHPEFNTARVGETIDRALESATADRAKRDPIASLSSATAPPEAARIINRTGFVKTEAGNLSGVNERQQKDSALRLAALIRDKSPALYRSAQVQLPLASLLRQTGLRSLPGGRPDEPFGSPGVLPAGFALFDQRAQKTVKCHLAERQPRIDGLLSDPCWESAEEIPLSMGAASEGEDGSHALVLTAYDARNLYFAMSVPRTRGLPTDGPASRRSRDQDLSRFDRIALCLDVDRDFVTWYTIEIDQRGCVNDACWGDPGWNPRMGVAAQGDAERWRIEGAIPFSALTPRSPQSGESWGLAVIRTVPAVRLESWTGPPMARPRPESFGILRFQ